MNKDQVKGRAKEAMGKVKQVFGRKTGNEKTEVKGAADRVAGKTQSAYGDAKSELNKNR